MYRDGSVFTSVHKPPIPMRYRRTVVPSHSALCNSVATDFRIQVATRERFAMPTCKLSKQIIDARLLPRASRPELGTNAVRRATVQANGMLSTWTANAGRVSMR
jgi:hypothetical protein